MARLKTANLPDLNTLKLPPNRLAVAVENALFRGNGGPRGPASTAERIAGRLAGAITLDHIQAGQRLIETDISELLQVSRAPVREALRMLERDKLVGFVPGRGAIVTAPDADDLRDIYSVRSALYCALLQRVMHESRDSLVVVFDRHMPELGRASKDSVDSYSVEVFLLNFAVFDTCNSPLLVELLQSMSLRTLRYARLGLTIGPGAIGSSLRGWRDLHRAIRGGEIEEVLSAALKRMNAARDAAIKALTL